MLDCQGKFPQKTLTEYIRQHYYCVWQLMLLWQGYSKILVNRLEVLVSKACYSICVS